ncbi:hypothetical protein [Streptomyces sp. WAC04114]|nr:hypothetical protein [Streptomyces sp. WAC04114]
MDSGVLPHLDRRLLPFERWLAQRIGRHRASVNGTPGPTTD